MFSRTGIRMTDICHDPAANNSGATTGTIPILKQEIASGGTDDLTDAQRDHADRRSASQAFSPFQLRER